jgi:hypothetical protein
MDAIKVSRINADVNNDGGAQRTAMMMTLMMVMMIPTMLVKIWGR